MPPETEYKKGAGDQTITIQYAGFYPRVVATSSIRKRELP